MAENESQWPAQYHGYGWPAAEEETASQSPADQVPPTTAEPASPAEPAPPAAPAAGQAAAQARPQPLPQASYPPPAPYPLAPQVPPAGYQQPPAGYPVPPAGYQVPPAGYPVPPYAGYQVPPGGYQVPPGGYQAPGAYQAQAGYHQQQRMHANMRAAATDRERTVDVLKAGFAEGRLTEEEYNDRMGRAYAARTYGELTALTADLPSGALPMPAWQAPVPAYPPPTSTNSSARAALVLGVAEFFTMGLTAIPAVICGHIAKKEIRLTGQRGDGMATAGLVLGYMAIVFWVIVIAMSVLGAAIQLGGAGG